MDFVDPVIIRHILEYTSHLHHCALV